MKQCCIVIPVYKNELDCVEEISLKRLYTVLGDTEYPVYLVCPDGLDVTAYQNLYGHKLFVEYFNPEYFTSTAAYSQLCINIDFYSAFS